MYCSQNVLTKKKKLRNNSVCLLLTELTQELNMKPPGKREEGELRFFPKMLFHVFVSRVFVFLAQVFSCTPQQQQ